MRLKLAALTPAEDKRWGQLMGIAWGMGMTDRLAAADAWKGLCEEFPRLRQYDGARA